ncbi:hypothetical protein, partial [Allobacillus sp. SKP2-8]|uniref:hypothetical protein n=1 Tax=Allobacillus sp. SKP2-8 TaxID=1955271 RepID=UPI001C91CFF7
SVFKNAIQNIGEVFVFLKRAIMKLILLFTFYHFFSFNELGFWVCYSIKARKDLFFCQFCFTIDDIWLFELVDELAK